VQTTGSHRQVFVSVQNRGKNSASKTRVDVWYAPVTGGLIPQYPDPAWRLIDHATHNVPGRSGQTPGTRTFGPFTWTAAAGHYAILAAASCSADRSNIDPATGYPCVTVPSPIAVLVACDNNLGLMTVNLP